LKKSSFYFVLNSFVIFTTDEVFSSQKVSNEFEIIEMGDLCLRKKSLCHRDEKLIFSWES